MSTGQCSRCRATYGCICVGSSTNRANWDTVSNPMGALQSIIHEQSNEIRSLRAALDEANTDRQRLAAENQQYRDDYEVTVSNDLLSVGSDGQVTLTFHGAREIMLRMGESLSLMLDEYDATNYLEFEAPRADGKKFILRVERYAHPKPHELRQQAESERDRAVAQVERVTILCELAESNVYGQSFVRVRDVLAALEDGAHDGA